MHKFSNLQKFIINEKKTHTVTFNTATSKDFYPRIKNEEGIIYNNCEQFKLLGIDVSTDERKGIKFDTYINNCIKKAYLNLWILRRLAELGISTEKLLLTYFLRIRVMIEQNSPLWMFNISKAMINKIEKIQKISVYIILGKDAHKDYLCNLAILNIEPLEVRREKIAERFASKILKHPEHRKIFRFVNNDRTRLGKRVHVPHTRTARYERSTVPSLAKIINEKLTHKF